MEIKLPKKLGQVVRAQIIEANELYKPAVAKATANKLFTDAIVEDAGYELASAGTYKLKEENGDIFIVSVDEGK